MAHRRCSKPRGSDRAGRMSYLSLILRHSCSRLLLTVFGVSVFSRCICKMLDMKVEVLVVVASVL